MTNYYRIPCVYGASKSTSTNGTEYTAGFTSDGLILTATEANAQVKHNIASKFKNLRVYISANSAGTTSTIKLRVNGADGGNSVSITAGATGWFEDTTNTDTTASGDKINFAIVKTDANNITIKTIAVDVLATTPYQKGGYTNGGNNLSAASTTTYIGIGSTAFSTTEGLTHKRRIRSSCSGKNLQVYISANARSTTTTVKSRLNGADGGQSISITAGATGWFEDTTNTDTLVDGDDFNASITTGTGSGTLTLQHTSCDIVGTTSTSIATGNAGGTQSTNTTRYLYPTGGMAGTIESTEANAQLKLRGTGTIQKMAVGSGTNGSNQTTTYTARKNSTDQSPTVSIAATTTGFSVDDSNSFTYADGDLVAVKGVRASGGSGTILVDWIAFELIPDVEVISSGSTFQPQIHMVM